MGAEVAFWLEMLWRLSKSLNTIGSASSAPHRQAKLVSEIQNMNLLFKWLLLERFSLVFTSCVPVMLYKSCWAALSK
jgi:hypothetical protein